MKRKEFKELLSKRYLSVARAICSVNQSEAYCAIHSFMLSKKKHTTALFHDLFLSILYL